MIAIEGIDGCGKGTQAARLAELLNNAYTLHFPNYESVTGQLIQQVLRGTLQMSRPGVIGLYDPHADALALQALMLTNRHEIMPVILGALAQGRNVVLDRYHVSGLVYGEYDGLDPLWLDAIHETLPKPDICFLLDIPAEESFRRRPERQDAYESNRDRIEKVRELYLKLYESKPNKRSWRGEPVRWVVIDGTLPADLIHQAMVHYLKYSFEQEIPPYART